MRVDGAEQAVIELGVGDKGRKEIAQGRGFHESRINELIDRHMCIYVRSNEGNRVFGSAGLPG